MRFKINKINPNIIYTIKSKGFNINNWWKAIQSTIKSANTVIGIENKNPSKPWFNSVYFIVTNYVTTFRMNRTKMSKRSELSHQKCKMEIYTRHVNTNKSRPKELQNLYQNIRKIQEEE